ncbi:hypothetical protein CYMTET_11934 [Cymbomonas tetramitiformis]|uniref:Uncharacterized protein n=1 Tax=Cymbomonas tetramitiformis TaxID=36881 RepID=A0AAE0GLI8_9CHLO|nr:hypothetical protein CYMTET_11934 [Cymbomonas tetramitiformis]
MQECKDLQKLQLHASAERKTMQAQEHAWKVQNESTLADLHSQIRALEAELGTANDTVKQLQDSVEADKVKVMTTRVLKYSRH